MKILSRSSTHQSQMPPTQSYLQLNDQLIIFLRTWGAADYNQKVVDEITHYISTTQADIEVTTPFDYNESISSSANRTRISLLLAHDLLYKTDNRTEYLVAFEALVMYRNKNELAWSSVGRFNISKLQNRRMTPILQIGSDLDREALLPIQLIGVEKEICMNSGSILIDQNTPIVVSSPFSCDIILNDADDVNHLVEAEPFQSTYWYSILTSG